MHIYGIIIGLAKKTWERKAKAEAKQVKPIPQMYKKWMYNMREWYSNTSHNQ